MRRITRRRITRTLLATSALAGLLCAPRDAHAAGFAIDTQSGRSTGMASAMTAMVDDSSAVFFNPAGIARGTTYADGEAGAVVIWPNASFTSADNSFTVAPSRTPPVLAEGYASAGIGNFAVGLGVNAPYGLTLTWPSAGQQRFLITKATLATYDFNPVVAYKFGPVRIGGGLQVVRSTVELKKSIDFVDTEGSIDLGAGTWGFGGNGGVQIEVIPKDRLSLGVNYRSAVTLSFDGNASFDNVPPAFATTIHDQPASARFVIPDTWAFGIAGRPIENLVIDADVVLYHWNYFRSIDVTFPQQPSLNTSEPKDWHNTVNYHVGAEYTINDTFTVRAGVMYDPTPSPPETLGPDVPDANRWNFAVGVTARFLEMFRADLGYQFIVFGDSTSTLPAFPGTYSNTVQLWALSLGAHL